MATNPDDLVGKKYGRLEVIRLSHMDHKCNAYFICRCDCGTVKNVARNHLISGKTKSCGCLKKNRAVPLSGIQKQVDDLRIHLDRSLKEIGFGAVYTVLDVLNGYLSCSAMTDKYQIVHVSEKI
ncbi:MAG: hypothetical protein AB9919_12245 [Geobacteraceae bacterium]